MKLLAILLVMLAALGVGLRLSSRRSASTVETTTPVAPVAADAPDARVDIAGEAEGATRTHAVEVTPTVEPVVSVAAENATPLGPGEAELVVRVISAEEQRPLAGVRLSLHPL